MNHIFERNERKIDTSNNLQTEPVAPKNVAIASRIKRFFERKNGDAFFREKFAVDPYQAVEDYNLDIDPEEIRSLWDEEFAKQLGEYAPVAESVKICRELQARGESSWQAEKAKAGEIADKRFKAWRDRQLARSKSQLKKVFHDNLLHTPVCFELSKGCSVGCWFCGVSAPRLSDVFIYNAENAQLWQDVLELIKEIIGEAASTGACYWATDPLDNPDYEKFCSDFHQILGNFPQTTTALALRNLDRTRYLLKLSREKGCRIGNRFSVLSKKVLDQIHQVFTAEELSFVKLALQNPESVQLKAVAGRAWERSKGKSDSEQSQEQSTIACVSGFLFNMVDRSVKLISPCPADKRWQNGYIIYDQGTFTDIHDLRQLLERMISTNMPMTIRSMERIRFRHDWKYEKLPNGFQISTRIMKRKFCNAPYLHRLGELICAGDLTAAEIAWVFEREGIPQVSIFDFLNSLFNKGVFDSEPQVEIEPTQVKDEQLSSQPNPVLPLRT